MLEMKWNIESSTLQQNGDEQREEKIIQVEVTEPLPIQQRVQLSYHFLEAVLLLLTTNHLGQL
jgi:hypothetical protein